MTPFEQSAKAIDAPAPRRRSVLLRNRDFMKLWAGETVSVFGSRVGDVAITFAAVIALGATPFQMGLLASARTLPELAFSLFAGVWVDRLHRRPILIAADVGRFILLATIPIAAVFGHLRLLHLCTAVIGAGVLDIAFNVAYRAYLPSLVGRGDLVDANSKLSASYAVAEVGGFGLAGWLVQWLTAPFAILIDAISFLVSAFAIAIIRTPEIPPPPKHRRAGTLREIAEGARFIAGDSRLFVIAASTPLAAFTYSLWGTMFMLFVVNDLGFKPGALGMIFAIGGVSSLASALVARRATEAIGAGRAIVFAFAVQGAALMLVPLAHGAALAAVVLLVGQQLIGDFAGTIFEITMPSLRQALAPHHIIGRVTATISFIARAATLLGALAAGWMGGVVGLRSTMFVGAAGLIVTAAILGFSPIWSIADPADLVAESSTGASER